MNLQTEFTSREFRSTVGLFATGIAVVTTRFGSEIYGVTVNSFTSVSLDPPLVLVCIERDGTMLQRLDELEQQGQSLEFAISFLNAEQEMHSRKFARQTGGEDFEPVMWGDGPPFVQGALGGVLCSVYKRVEAGDHEIVIGQVLALWQTDSPPGALLYYRGRYEQGRF